MDILSYEYHQNTNQLKNVNDTGNANYGFKDGSELATEYTYDANGNMLTDANKNITSVEYNHLNMPTKITVTGANAGVLQYKYSADGVKLRKIKTQGGTSTTTDYNGNYVYENGDLKQVTQPEGYIEPNGSDFTYVYQLKDHQGNVRVTYSDTNNDGYVTSSEIRRESNYYPFGLEHVGYNGSITGVKNNFKQFQGQEYTEDLKLNTHEWKYRMSDPAIGRFWQVDPLAEDYYYNGTYNFAENRLIDGVELEGLEWIHYQSYETGSGGYRSQATGKVDYDNWALNAYYKATGHQFEYFPVHVVAAPDGKHYLFATEDEALVAQAEDFNPETRHTLEGINALFQTTDALGMALTGMVAKGKTPKPKEAYNRRKHYGNTPTKADRKHFGATKDQVVDHKTELVKHYYEGADGSKPGYLMTKEQRKVFANDRSKMQLQSKKESHKQGGKASAYSKKQKKKYELD